jgi:hypothetical protein
MDVVGEIEASRLIEDEVVGRAEGDAPAVAIEDCERARRQVHALDAGFDPILGAEATVVTEVERAVGADSGTVRSTTHDRDAFDGAVTIDAGDAPATDLGNQHAAIAHRDRALGESEAVGNELDLTKFRHDLPLT